MVGQTAVGEDLVDHMTLGGLDEADDLHAAAAARADEGVDFPHVLDEGRPAAAGLVGGGSAVVGPGGRVVRGVGFGATTSRRTGVEAKVVGEVLSGVGDVLGEFGDEVQGIEDLEVAADAAEEVGARGLGEGVAVGLQPAHCHVRGRPVVSRLLWKS